MTTKKTNAKKATSKKTTKKTAKKATTKKTAKPGFVVNVEFVAIFAKEARNPKVRQTAKDLVGVLEARNLKDFGAGLRVDALDEEKDRHPITRLFKGQKLREKPEEMPLLWIPIHEEQERRAAKAEAEAKAKAEAEAKAKAEAEAKAKAEAEAKAKAEAEAEALQGNLDEIASLFPEMEAAASARKESEQVKDAARALIPRLIDGEGSLDAYGVRPNSVLLDGQEFPIMSHHDIVRKYGRNNDLKQVRLSCAVCDESYRLGQKWTYYGEDDNGNKVAKNSVAQLQFLRVRSQNSDNTGFEVHYKRGNVMWWTLVACRHCCSAAYHYAQEAGIILWTTTDHDGDPKNVTYYTNSVWGAVKKARDIKAKEEEERARQNQTTFTASMSDIAHPPRRNGSGSRNDENRRNGDSRQRKPKRHRDRGGANSRRYED